MVHGGKFFNLNNSSNSSIQSDTLPMIAGEPLKGAEKPVPVYISKDGLIIKQTQYNSYEKIFGVNKLAQTFSTDFGTTSITNISLYLEKSGSPEGEFIISLHTITQNNEPENTALSQTIISANSIQNGWNSFSLPTPVMSSSSYAIVVCVPNGDNSNYIKWKKQNSNVYNEGKVLNSTNFGFDWSEFENEDFSFKVYSNNRVYACKANNLNKLDFIGFAISNAETGEEVIIQVNGIVKGFNDLQVGKKYYIQDNSEININTGFYKKLAGIALNKNKISIFWSDSLEFANKEEAFEGVNDYKIMSPKITNEILSEVANPLIYNLRKLIPSETGRAFAGTQQVVHSRKQFPKNIQVNLSGTVRVKFRMKAIEDEFSVQLFTNDDGKRTFSTTSTEYVSYSYDVLVESGDTILLKWIKGSGYVCCFGLYWDVEMIPAYRILTD
jgi:hypothetical protein